MREVENYRQQPMMTTGGASRTTRPGGGSSTVRTRTPPNADVGGRSRGDVVSSTTCSFTPAKGVDCGTRPGGGAVSSCTGRSPNGRLSFFLDFFFDEDDDDAAAAAAEADDAVGVETAGVEAARGDVARPDSGERAESDAGATTRPAGVFTDDVRRDSPEQPCGEWSSPQGCRS